MRILKEPEVRRNEILDAAEELFARKGFDDTSTNEILEKAGIARGTLYYHFKSKEDIMDGLIERQSKQLLEAAKKVADNQEIAVTERLLQTVLSLRLETPDGNEPAMEYIHKPQNALMHQKVLKSMVESITPLLAGLAQEGVEQGIFQTKYPYECMEMAVIYAGTLFDDGAMIPLTQEQLGSRAQAFLYHLERMLGVENGSLSAQMSGMFERK